MTLMLKKYCKAWNRIIMIIINITTPMRILLDDLLFDEVASIFEDKLDIIDWSLVFPKEEKKTRYIKTMTTKIIMAVGFVSIPFK